MNSYFYTLLVTSVCGAVCAVLAHGGYEKYIKYIASLICVLIMISPFRSIDIGEIAESAENELSVADTEYGGGLYRTAATMTEQRAESYISEIVFNKFGIKPGYTHIKIDWEKKEPVIESITVAVSADAKNCIPDVKDYLCRVLGGEVEVIEG